jgi:hypothetical protein
MKTTRIVRIGQFSGLLLGTASMASALAGTPGFANQQAFSTGSGAWCTTTADLNGDGMPDLIVANSTDGTISVLMNTATAGSSSPSYADQQIFTVGSGPSYVEDADVNGDGIPDLVVVNGDGTISVLINTTVPGASVASFAPQQTFPIGTMAHAVAVADMNGDGVPDLIVTNYGDSTVSVLLNTTAPGAVVASFAPQQAFYTVGGPYSVQAVDMNGDGLPDLVVSEFDFGTVSVLLNTTPAASSTVSFSAEQDFTTGAFPVSLAVIDMNGDGLPDLVTTNEGDNTVSVLLNTTQMGDLQPSFADQQVFAVGNAPEDLEIADVDGDGALDLIVPNFGDNTVSVLSNTTAPGSMVSSFTQQTFAVGSQPTGATVGDENGDGKLDIVVANSADSTVSVLLNTTP